MTEAPSTLPLTARARLNGLEMVDTRGDPERPLAMASYTLAYALCGDSPACQKGPNIVLHLLTGGALFLFLSLLTSAGRQRQLFTLPVWFPLATRLRIRVLGAGGINPDKDITLITIPPPQMVANMKVGKMDGFCVGEPWNARSIAEGIGFTAINTQDIWKDHPEKVCAFTAEFAEKNPRTVKAVLKALNEASVWLDDLANRPEQCEIVCKPTYINCPKELILGRMLGKYDTGDGRVYEDPNYMIFSQRNCNYPQLKYAKWWLTQFRRWGMVEGVPDYEGVAKQVMRPDIYEEAMKEVGYAHGGASSAPETLFDGKTFDPAKSEEYATSFEVNNMKG